ncbi:MAG: hypothetical protein ACJ76A_10875 [Actinomycetota bacterium]|jgi:hypothetical protein
MTRLADERGGALAKLLGILLVLAVCASGAVYVYGKTEQPLSADIAHTATSEGGREPTTVAVAPNVVVYVAEIVHNDGRLPVTIEGLAEQGDSTEPYVPIAIELGDGKTPKPTNGAFVPPSLDANTGIGVVVTYAINPNLDCSSYGARPSGPTPFPPLPLRLSTYGVDTMQTVRPDLGLPKVSGITRASCERALP